MRRLSTLTEFAYNNSYQASIKMSPFEALYGRKCHTPLSWSQPEDKLILGPEALQEMEKVVKNIQQNIKTTQDRHKSYAYKKRIHREFSVGEQVYLRINPKNSTLHIGSYAKLAPRYYGPFEVLEGVGRVAYMLVLPSHIKVHDVFHVSLLKKYVHDPTHVIDWNVLQVELEGELLPKPIQILAQEEIELRNRTVARVKVRWRNFAPKEATWE